MQAFINSQGSLQISNFLVAAFNPPISMRKAVFKALFRRIHAYRQIYMTKLVLVTLEVLDFDMPVFREREPEQ
jgi:hypothetical protein